MILIMVAVPKDMNSFDKPDSITDDVGLIRKLEEGVASRIAAGEVINFEK
jgi:hypothetical protein